MTPHVKALFLDWLENRTRRRTDIESHLQECAECRLYYRTMTNLLDPGVASDFPRLKPDPFMPARVVSRAAEQHDVQSAWMLSKLRLSLEGLAFVIAVLAGIVIGKTLSAESPDNSTEEILSIYNMATSPEDLSTQMESILDPTKGDHQ